MAHTRHDERCLLDSGLCVHDVIAEHPSGMTLDECTAHIYGRKGGPITREMVRLIERQALRKLAEAIGASEIDFRDLFGAPTQTLGAMVEEAHSYTRTFAS